MPLPCSICCHNRRLEIELAILRGESYPSIAQRYAVSADSVGRHKRNGHIAERLIIANWLADQDESFDLFREARALLGELKYYTYLAEASRSWRTAIEGCRAQLDVLRALGLEKEGPDDDSLNELKEIFREMKDHASEGVRVSDEFGNPAEESS